MYIVQGAFTPLLNTLKGERWCEHPVHFKKGAFFEYRGLGR